MVVFYGFYQIEISQFVLTDTVLAKNHDGNSAIHLAAFYGHIEVIELLVDYGANVNEANSSGYMPLHVACQNNKVEAVSKLLQLGANPCLRNQVSSWVPLHEAAWNGCIECNGLILYLI